MVELNSFFKLGLFSSVLMTIFYVVGTYLGHCQFCLNFIFWQMLLMLLLFFIAWECYWNSNYLNW